MPRCTRERRSCGRCSLLRAQVHKAKRMREAISQHMDDLLGDDGVLMVPSAPGPAPMLNLPQNELNTYRKQLISLTSIAGLAKLPQV